MKKIRKRSIFLLLLFIIPFLRPQHLHAEDSLVSHQISVRAYFVGSSAPAIWRDQSDFRALLVIDGLGIGACGSTNLQSGTSAWYVYDGTCWTLPPTYDHPTYGTLQLYRNGVPHDTTIYFGHAAYHGWSQPVAYIYEGNATSPSATAWSGTGERYGTGYASQDQLIEYTYRGSVTYTVTHYAPTVDGQTPTPPNSLTDTRSAITGLSGVKDVNVGETVPTTPDNLIKGGFTNMTLAYVAGTNTTLSGHYTVPLRTILDSGSIIEDNVFTAVGSITITWGVRDYQGDQTNFTVRYNVIDPGNTDINIYFPGTRIPYDGRWMSTHPSADTTRRGGLDVQGSSDISGNYDLSTFISGSKEQTNAVNKASGNPDPVTNDVISGWSIADSTTAGIPATSQAFVINDPNTSLSGVSTEKRMYFDSTKPTITEVETTNDWVTITTNAQDEASGIGGSEPYDVGDVFFKFVPRGENTGITTPTDGTDWISIADYEAAFAALNGGEYDLYVYAKDNATNRSEAIKANKDEPIIIAGGTATITIKKTVVGPKGGANDVFLINLNDNSTNALITSVALTDGETSSSLTLDIGSGPSKTIKLSEIIPMDYKSGFKYNVTKKAGDQTTISGNTITIFPGDTIRIEVENTFEPTGYFKAKDFVKNIFKS